MVSINTERIDNDLKISKQICEELRSGNRDCLDKLFIDYNKFFLNFARRRLFNPAIQEDVVQSFWEELMNARAICKYAQGTENSASLKTYLLTILYFRIIDANRKNSKNREVIGLERILEQPDPPHREIEKNSEALIRRLVHEALLKLSEKFPQDASLVKMYLDGLTYSQMAERLGKNSDAIKKQFTRVPMGSLAKFKKALVSIMEVKGLKYADL